MKNKNLVISNIESYQGFLLCRLIVLIFILVTSVFLRQNALGMEIIVKIYAVSAASFFLALMSVLFWSEVRKISLFIPYQMLYDILLTSYLIYHTGINESIFLFLYVLNIILAAVIFQIWGALTVSFIAGITYGAIYYVNKDTSQDSLLYTLFYNELFFLLTALLSGQFMDENKKRRHELDQQKADIDRLNLLKDKLLNNLPIGIILADKDDSVETLNATALQILELENQEMDVVKFQELLPEIAGIRSVWPRLSEEDRIKYQFRHVCKSGKSVNLQLQVVEINSDDTSSGAEMVLAFHDISKITELEEKLNYESQLAVTGQLAAGIAHEIRTPLASISGSIETLMKNIEPKNEDDKKLIAISMKETKRLNNLITEFLQFAKPVKDTDEEVDVLKVLDEVRDAINFRVEDMVNVSFDLNIPEECKIQSHPEKLKQVFLNLFINSLEAKSADSDIVIKINFEYDGKRIAIKVQDNGTGIDEKIRSSVFKPFYTTKKNGTGLGLATIARIIQNYDGTIRALPSDNGALFEITFPESRIIKYIAG